MSSAKIAKQIHDADQILKGLSIEDQEAHNIVESLKRIEQITSKVKAQAQTVSYQKDFYW